MVSRIRGDAQLGVEVPAHELDRPQQLLKALKRVVLALNRNQDFLGRDEALTVSRPSDGGQSIST